MDTVIAQKLTPIPRLYRDAVESIDRALGIEVCSTFLLQPPYPNKSQLDPLRFAEACFYYLDSIGNDPVDPVGFASFLSDSGCIAESRYILGRRTFFKSNIR